MTTHSQANDAQVSRTNKFVTEPRLSERIGDLSPLITTPPPPPPVPLHNPNLRSRSVRVVIRIRFFILFYFFFFNENGNKHGLFFLIPIFQLSSFFSIVRIS